MDFDAILEDVGAFGRYQKLVIYFILLPAVIPCGFHAYAQLFMAARVTHWCRVPELEHLDNLDAVKNLSVPLEMRNGVLQYSECSMYKLNYTEIVNNRINLDNIPKDSRSEIVSCTHGWNYDRSVYKNTVVTEWNLVCSRDFYPTLGLILLAVGGIIGNYIFGYVQDTLGRKPSFFIYLFIECIFGVATSFAQNYVIWIIYRIGVGFTVPAIMTTPYVLAIELVGPRYRTLCTILSNIAYSLGLIMLAGVVYIVRDWRHLALATTLPFICLFLYLWLMPESPRWLLARGQFDKAEVILKNIARINGKSLPANYMVQLHRKYETDNKLNNEVQKAKSRKYGILDLFRTPNLRKKTVIITFIWFTNTSVYVGLSYYAPVLGGDEFLNFFLAGVVELPTYLFLWPSMERLGRRWTLCMSMVVGGVACLTTFLVQHESYVTLALYCVGKMGISSSFVVLPLMASELYPTVVRGLGMSLSSVLGMLGPIFIPLVNYLGSDIMILPLIIMGTLLVAGGIASLLLPETLNQHLPQTLEDGERMGLDTDFCCKPPVKETIPNKKLAGKDTEESIYNTDNPVCSVQMVDVLIMEKTIESAEKQCEKVEFVFMK